MREQQRRRQRWRRVADNFVDWISTLGADEAGCEEAGFIATPDAEWLASAVKQLPARQSEVLHLVFQQELSLSEAAAVMGVSVGSSRQHYDRAKKKLRSLLPVAPATPACDHAAR